MDYKDRLRIEKELSEMTDRQLQEKIAFQLIDTKQNANSIKNNVQFFFWATIVSVVLTLLISLNS